MTDETKTATGKCLCGAVRFEAKGPSFRVIACHCESCRRHTGAPMAALTVFSKDQVHWSGEERRVYESQPGVGRAFCPNCGSSLTWETTHPHYGTICAIHVSSFDDPDAQKPSAHSFYPEKLCWFDSADDLPRYETFVADGKLARHGPDIIE